MAAFGFFLTSGEPASAGFVHFGLPLSLEADFLSLGFLGATVPVPHWMMFGLVGLGLAQAYEGMGLFGLVVFAGPALIGFLAQGWSLPAAFVLVAIALVAVAVLGRRLTRD